jgi:hypothetical protein
LEAVVGLGEVDQADLLNRRNRPVIRDLDPAVVGLGRRRQDLDHDHEIGRGALPGVVLPAGDGEVGFVDDAGTAGDDRRLDADRA